MARFVLFVLFWCKFFPFGLLTKLKRLHPTRFMSLKTGIFIRRDKVLLNLTDVEIRIITENLRSFLWPI
jgi:hypothetical protein